MQYRMALVPCAVHPSYHGAREAGISSLEMHAHPIATAAGRGEEGPCDDVDAERAGGDIRIRRNGSSADEMRSRRRTLGERERERLWSRYGEHGEREREAWGDQPGAQLERLGEALVDRRAVDVASGQTGLVCFRRRCVHHPVQS